MTDSIGRLIVEDVLLRSERQLLPNRDTSGQKPQDQPSQSIPAPISHNDKVVASVLLTLLDEQIVAATINAKELLEAKPKANGEAAPAATRVAAQYAEVDATLRPDTPVAQTNLLPNAANQQILLAAASPELRMAMQAAFFSAAVRAQEGFSTTSDAETRRREIASGMTASTLMRIGAGVFTAIVLVIVVAASFAR